MAVDTADETGVTALHIAASEGHDLLCSTLLARGADARTKDHCGQTALHKACRAGSVECCRIFTKHGVDLDLQDTEGMTALHLAARKGGIYCLELLVSSGASLNIPDMYGRIPLHYASAHGCFETVYSLVFLGSDCDLADADGRLPLHFAASADATGESVDYLLKHCRDVNVADSKGCTPLLYAVLGGRVAGLKSILAAPGVHLRNEGSECPVCTATSYGYIDVLKLLLPLCGTTLPTNKKGTLVACS